MMLRIGRRRASYTAADSREFCEIECWDRKKDAPDQKLSVYSIDDSESTITRVHAEHAAGVGLDPPRGGSHWDVSEPGQQVRKTMGLTGFSFANEAHRELEFSSPDAVMEFAKHIWAHSDARRRNTALTLLQAYVHSRLAEADPEWTKFCASSPKGAAWRAAKWR